MSLSFRKLPLAALGLVLANGESPAADFYFVPEAALRAEHHSDFELRSGFQGDTSVEGYFADLGGTLGWRSERGLTQIRPLITVQEYPDRKDLQRSNQYLDWRSQYKSLRSDFLMVARYRREDQYRADVPDAGYDEFDPEDPTVTETGRVVVFSETQTNVQIRPEYEYKFSQRMGIGAKAMFQSVSFDADIPTGRDDYDSSEITGFLSWDLAERTDLKTGVYVSEYTPDDDVNKTTGRGISFELERNWTETFVGTAELVAERTEVDVPGPGVDKSDNWGLTVGAVSRGQVSQLRFDVGRSFTPSLGSRATIDQVRVQYNRGLTQRLQLTSALRAFKREAQGVDNDGDNRDYARGEIGLRWNVTPTWYTGGSYSYIWQKYEDENESSNDQVFMLTLGYRGLAPQR